MNVRVPGFLPTINGLHFTNSWPTGTGPDYTFNVLGQTIKLGDASNGLCGGMVYTVKDLFDTRLLPPADAALPVDGSPLFNYIVARLTQSFNEDDVNQYLSYIQMFDHDTFVEGHGLAWHEIMEEWPKIKSDLDAGGLSPLGLVHGQEPPTVGFFTGIQDLGNCHQVLAWGYDLNGSSLTIHIYDPDYIGDQNTITLDIANPAHTTPITVSNHNGFYRGFFRTHYAYHDPRTPVSAAFIATVVRSPGIVSPGPLPPRPDEPGGYVLIPGKVKAISGASGNAGSPLLFVIGTDDQVYAHLFNFDSNGNPVGGNYVSIPGKVKAISGASGNAGSPLLFVIGTDDQAYAHPFGANLKPVGGYVPIPGKVKAISGAWGNAGRPLLFVIGTDDQVYAHLFDANGNLVGGYVPIPGKVKAISWAWSNSGKPLLLVIGSDDQVYANQFDPNGNPVGGYVPIPGKVKAISGAWGNASRPLLLVIGTDDQVYAQELGLRLAGGSV